MLIRILTLVVSISLGAAVILFLLPEKNVPAGFSPVPLYTESSPPGVSPYINARVNGRPVKLLLDTGGEVSCLPLEFKEALAIRRETTTVDSNGTRKGYVTRPASLELNGNALGFYEFNIHGEYTKLTHGREVWVTSTPTVGLNVLSCFRIGVNGSASTLTFRDDSAPLDGDGWIPYRGFFESPHLVVQAFTPNGRALQVLLDTGYSYSRISSSCATAGSESLVLKFGSTVVRSSEAQLIDTDPEFEVTHSDGRKIQIQATLGWNVLRNYPLEISPRNKKLRLMPRSSEK